MKLLEAGCCYYGNRDKVKALLSLCQVKALVTSHVREDWLAALSVASQVSRFTYLHTDISAFCALTLLVGQQEGHLAGKKLSGARCRLAYGPADSTATHCLLLQ